MSDRPPAHPLYDSGPSEYVSSASGSPSLLTDRERALLMRLAVENLMRQFPGCDELTAAAALDHFAARGESHIVGDQKDVYLKVCGHTHIHCARDWLRYTAEGGRN
jgi:hypothetical protein